MKIDGRDNIYRSSRNVPFVDLRAQYDNIKTEINVAIQNVLDSTTFILGEDVENFEEDIAKYFGVKYAIGTSSGTSALELALLSLGIQSKYEVITVPNTFMATTEAISRAGGNVKFVDIDPYTYNIDVSKIEEKITSKTKVVIPVHLYGHPTDMGPIIELSEKYGLNIIEDTAQAHGAQYKNKKVGSFGDAGCFSFYPSKNLGAYGDAGCVVTNNEKIAEKVRLLRDHGRKNKYEHIIEGGNHRLDTIQAAILRVKLKYLDKWTESRRKNAKLYNRLLEDTGVIIPVEKEYCRHVYHLYVVRSQNRDRLQQHMKSKGISVGIHYPIPLHLQPAYSYLRYRRGDFPVAEKCAKEILSLPMFAELKSDDITYVANQMKEFNKE